MSESDTQQTDGTSDPRKIPPEMIGKATLASFFSRAIAIALLYELAKSCRPSDSSKQFKFGPTA